MTLTCLLTETLRNPALANRYSATEWDLLIRQARSARLLGYLAQSFLEQNGKQVNVPDYARYHLESAQWSVKRQNEALDWEFKLLKQVFRDDAIPIIALKGGAYVLADLPISRGRLFHDIDIMVPREAIEKVETRLQAHGWKTTHNNAYDQRYYRQWMHELPPMTHRERETVLDIHHSILPLTARIHPDAGKLIENATPDPENRGILWFAPEDMVLHSMTHLFHDGELENGLRDLVDIESLLSHFGKEEAFWSRLCERALILQLTRPLFYGLQYARLILGTHVPQETIETVAPWGPGRMVRKLMDLLFTEALLPAHHSCHSRTTGTARWLLFVRAHYLRMPLRLLLPHLIHKALIKDLDKEEELSNKFKQIFADQEKE
ncbi:MAG: nucleotidyltransferase family protein [Gammaproteobacteria bacterium]|nr:nucleotidyltransferase family protein [Gammaproteobacteria bacterium]